MSTLTGDPLPGSELAAFAAAVETASIHGAADALDLTQSAVTKRIQHLERRIGGELLERGRFGARPTALGRAVYPPARRALQELDEVMRAAAHLRAERAPRLALAASATTGEFLVPGWLAEFRRVAPEVRPELEITNSPGALAALRERRADDRLRRGAGPARRLGLDLRPARPPGRGRGRRPPLGAAAIRRGLGVDVRAVSDAGGGIRNP